MKSILVNSKEGAIAYFPKPGITLRFNHKETEKFFKLKPGKDDHIELVHINITNKCTRIGSRKCSYCYVPSGKYEMPLRHFKKIVDKCVKSHVFQITLGGGETFLHSDIHEIVDYASKRINMAVTTNGDIWLRKDTMKKFRQVNISYHEDLAHLETCLKWLSKLRIKRGINYVYNKSTKNVVEDIAKLAKKYDAELLVLQFKPVHEEWDLYVSPEETFKVAKGLADRKEFSVAIDGATCLFCASKKKFLTIGLKGEVYPCSFIHEPNMGNILTDDFKDIWKNRGKRITCPYMSKEDQEKLEKNMSKFKDKPFSLGAINFAVEG